MRGVGLVVQAWLLLSVQVGAGEQNVFVTRSAGGNPVFSDKAAPGATPVTPVSYTHLDVYKRQLQTAPLSLKSPAWTMKLT